MWSEYHAFQNWRTHGVTLKDHEEESLVKLYQEGPVGKHPSLFHVGGFAKLPADGLETKISLKNNMEN